MIIVISDEAQLASRSKAPPAPDRGGHFAHWESLSLGGSEVYLSSRDGIDESDEIPTLPAGAHSHFNWAFSALRQIGWVRIGPRYGFRARAGDRNQLTMCILSNPGLLANIQGNVLRTLGQVDRQVRHAGIPWRNCKMLALQPRSLSHRFPGPCQASEASSKLDGEPIKMIEFACNKRAEISHSRFGTGLVTA